MVVSMVGETAYIVAGRRPPAQHPVNFTRRPAFEPRPIQRMSTSNSPEGPPILNIDGARATIRLNRPTHLNRMHREDLIALRDICTQLVGERSVRAIVLTASGRVFCAGYNIGEFRRSDEEAPSPEGFEETVDAIEHLPQPTVCRINGSVYGGGVDLALACDFRVGVRGMELRMPAARLGLHYYPSGLVRAVSRLGVAGTKELFLLARSQSDEDLERIGFLDRLVESDKLDLCVDEYVEAIDAAAPLAIQGMKRSIDEIARGALDIEAARRREADCAHSHDMREGLSAWNERRMPRFEGR
jgi:enoyl-CoA hydratase/carnithine racemase